MTKNEKISHEVIYMVQINNFEGICFNSLEKAKKYQTDMLTTASLPEPILSAHLLVRDS
jgi:hypothetical protein